MIIGNRTFDTKSGYYIMGILNLTPDSFSDGGRYYQKDKALYRVQEMIQQGVDIIDIGGESTRPGHVKISEEEEIQRISQVLESMKEHFDIPISLDTYKSKVVDHLHDYIDMVNDVYGLNYDGTMAEVVARHNLSCCIMAHKTHGSNNEAVHNHLTSGDRFGGGYGDYIDSIASELTGALQLANKAGIADNRIMLDGGVGFGKNYEQNLTTINETKTLVNLGYPVLMATSNKGFMSKITGNVDKDRRDETVTTTIYGAMQGARFFRVHNVEANKRALQMLEAIELSK